MANPWKEPGAISPDKEAVRSQDGSVNGCVLCDPEWIRALVEQRERADHQALSFEERLGLLVDLELQDRENRRLQRSLKSAKLRGNAFIEDLDFRRPRGLDRSQMLNLAESLWVANHHNVLIVGATGLGKTYVACALAHSAIRHRHSALYLRGPRMLDDLAIARADGRLTRLLASWARVDVLVIDLCRPRNYADILACGRPDELEHRHQRGRRSA